MFIRRYQGRIKVFLKYVVHLLPGGKSRKIFKLAGISHRQSVHNRLGGAKQHEKTVYSAFRRFHRGERLLHRPAPLCRRHRTVGLVPVLFLLARPGGGRCGRPGPDHRHPHTQGDRSRRHGGAHGAYTQAHRQAQGHTCSCRHTHAGSHSCRRSHHLSVAGARGHPHRVQRGRAGL